MSINKYFTRQVAETLTSYIASHLTVLNYNPNLAINVIAELDTYALKYQNTFFDEKQSDLQFKPKDLTSISLVRGNIQPSSSVHILLSFPTIKYFTQMNSYYDKNNHLHLYEHALSNALYKYVSKTYPEYTQQCSRLDATVASKELLSNFFTKFASLTYTNSELKSLIDQNDGQNINIDNEEYFAAQLETIDTLHGQANNAVPGKLTLYYGMYKDIQKNNQLQHTYNSNKLIGLKSNYLGVLLLVYTVNNKVQKVIKISAQKFINKDTNNWNDIENSSAYMVSVLKPEHIFNFVTIDHIDLKQEQKDIKDLHLHCLNI